MHEVPLAYVELAYVELSFAVAFCCTCLSQHLVEGATQGLIVGTGDTLFAYVYLDPKNPPKEIMLQWHTDTWRHRAFWGDNLIAFGNDNTDERRRLGGAEALRELHGLVDDDLADAGEKGTQGAGEG